jgi:hypothetical protein
MLFSMLSLSVLGLTGCGSANNQEDVQAAAETDEKEGQAVKQELKAELESLKKQNKEQSGTKGYLDEHQYVALSNEFNILALSVDKEYVIEMNDEEHINENISKIAESVDSLSSSDALEAKKLMNSSQTVYEAVFMEDLHHVLNWTDLKSDDNQLSSFINTANEAGSVDAIYEEAKSSQESIEFSEMKFIGWLKQSLDLYGEKFSADELNMLQSAVQNLDSSMKTQVQILKMFNPVYVEDGSTQEEKFDSANTDFLDAENSVSELETLLEVEYVEE